MKFNGPAPELINGRLAMIGILAAANNEIQTGQTVLQQALTASPWVYVMLLVWIYASLVPITKGARHEPFGKPQLCIRCEAMAGSHGWLVIQVSQWMLQQQLQHNSATIMYILVTAVPAASQRACSGVHDLGCLHQSNHAGCQYISSSNAIWMIHSSVHTAVYATIYGLHYLQVSSHPGQKSQTGERPCWDLQSW